MNKILALTVFSLTLFGTVWTVLFEIFNISISKLWISFFEHFELSPYILGVIAAFSFLLIVAYFTHSVLSSVDLPNKKISKSGSYKIFASSLFVTLLVFVLFSLKFSFSIFKERKQLVSDFYTTICKSANPIAEVRKDNLSVDLSPLYLHDDYITMSTILNISKVLTDKTVEINKDYLNDRIIKLCNKIEVSL